MGLYRRRSHGRESGSEGLSMATARDKSVPEEPAPAPRGDASRTELRIPGRPGRLRRYEPTLIGVGSVLMFLIVWQAGASARLGSPLFLPAPLDIGETFVAFLAQGQITNELWVSGQGVVVAHGTN